MKDKKVLVLLKYFQGELNPFDGSALECAIESGAKEIIALTMAPKSVQESFRSLTRLGVKGVFITDTVYAGSDTQATSRVLAKAIEKIKPDVIFCGRQSIDGDTAQVPPMLAERIGFDIKVKVVEFNGNAGKTRSGQNFEIENNTIYTFEKIRTLRFPSIFSKLSEIEVIDNSILGLKSEECGLSGSPTRVVKSYESSVGRRDCEYTCAENLTKLIEIGLHKSRKYEENDVGEKLDVVYFVGKVEKVAKSVAHRAIELNVNKMTANDVALMIRDIGAKTVLFEDSEDKKVLASRVAVLLNAGLCADCISFRVENGKLVMTRPAQGGNVTADIVCTSEIAFATVRSVKENGSDIIFSVGKGAVDYIDKIKEFAKKFGAEICCSRIVADSGRLPYEMQVGLTGRTVSPKVYVAFGISGAVQHTCAISGAGTVIAVNTDKNARIFDYADYGIITEVQNVEL
ncbi:MAG: FAD-binding protein [Clostridia bacterium]|nr:FAD-binding protein [Clostridia bacterium]